MISDVQVRARLNAMARLMYGKAYAACYPAEQARVRAMEREYVHKRSVRVARPVYGKPRAVRTKY